jgi:hypothetical protein
VYGDSLDAYTALAELEARGVAPDAVHWACPERRMAPVVAVLRQLAALSGVELHAPCMGTLTGTNEAWQERWEACTVPIPCAPTIISVQWQMCQTVPTSPSLMCDKQGAMSTHRMPHDERGRPLPHPRRREAISSGRPCTVLFAGAAMIEGVSRMQASG